LLFTPMMICHCYHHISFWGKCDKIFLSTPYREWWLLSHLAVISLLMFHPLICYLQSPKWNIQTSPLEQNAALVEKYYLSWHILLTIIEKNWTTTYMTRLYQCMNFFTVLQRKETCNFGWIFISMKWIFCVVLFRIRIIIVFIHYHNPIMTTSCFSLIRMSLKVNLISFVFQIYLYCHCFKKGDCESLISFSNQFKISAWRSRRDIVPFWQLWYTIWQSWFQKLVAKWWSNSDSISWLSALTSFCISWLDAKHGEQ